MRHDLVLHALQQEHFFPFVWNAFELLHPGLAFIPSWHVEAMCYALEKVASGETKRLLITVPPRHGKSICTAVAFPSWLLGKDPGLKIMVASYGGDLASKHARDFRTVITSSWFTDLFPGTRLEVGATERTSRSRPLTEAAKRCPWAGPLLALAPTSSLSMI